MRLIVYYFTEAPVWNNVIYSGKLYNLFILMLVLQTKTRLGRQNTKFILGFISPPAAQVWLSELNTVIWFSMDECTGTIVCPHCYNTSSFSSPGSFFFFKGIGTIFTAFYLPPSPFPCENSSLQSFTLLQARRDVRQSCTWGWKEGLFFLFL